MGEGRGGCGFWKKSVGELQKIFILERELCYGRINFSRDRGGESERNLGKNGKFHYQIIKIVLTCYQHIQIQRDINI